MIYRILEIVVFLIDYFRENRNHLFSIDDLSSSLKAKGYTETEISSAYSWLLEKYENAPDQYFSNFPEIQTSTRIFTDAERHYFTIDAQGFLLKLLSFALIDNEQFEAIVERAIMVGGYPIDVEQIKVLATSLIFKDLNEIDRLSIFDDDIDPLHIIN